MNQIETLQHACLVVLGETEASGTVVPLESQAMKDAKRGQIAVIGKRLFIRIADTRLPLWAELTTGMTWTRPQLVDWCAVNSITAATFIN